MVSVQFILAIGGSKISKKVYAVISATGLMSFSGVLVETAMNVTFPTLMKQFGLATNTVQWMTSIYLLVISVIVPLSAALKSSFKTKQLFVTANLLFFAGLLLDALAPNFAILLLGRAIQGLGTGIALPLMFNIILEQVPADKIGLMMGFGNLITGVAPALGPTFGGLVINNLGWRYVFFFLMPLIILSLFLGLYGIQQKSKIVKIKPEFSAQGNAFLNTIQQFAGAIGTSLTSAIVALSQDQYGSKDPRPTAIGTQHAFIFLAVIVVFLWFMFYKNMKIEGGSK